jgi:6-pyruvoyltetrahydropterin/6-carboxytetrahydropterin synthase
MQISKKIEWCMGHRLPNHKGKCVNLHGHQYVLEVVLEGEVNAVNDSPSVGMVMDYGDLKNILDKEVHDVCDHAFMVAESDDLMMGFYKKNHQLKHVVVPFESTAENIAGWIFEKLNNEIGKLPGKMALVSVQLWETPYNSARVGGG